MLYNLDMFKRFITLIKEKLVMARHLLIEEYCYKLCEAVKKDLTKAEFAKTLGRSTTYVDTTSSRARRMGITIPKLKRQSPNRATAIEINQRMRDGWGELFDDKDIFI